MSRNKIFIGFILLLFFAICVSGQVKENVKEVQIDSLLRKENFDRFQFLVSTQENIKGILGDNCYNSRCFYDDDWSMRFIYAGKVAETRWYQLNQPRNRVFTTYTKPEFIGKLIGIHFDPRRKNVLRDDFVFPADFKCLENGGREFNCWGNGIFVKYNYKKREDGTIYQKEIVYIWVGITKAESDAIKGETEIKDIPEKGQSSKAN
jgi:hypothetical protein